MDMSKYMTFKANWEQLDSEDEDTHMASYKKAEEITCFQYGKDIFVRDDASGTTVSAKSYLTLKEVKPDDKIDGQTVRSVNMYPEGWGPNAAILYEVLTWEV